jgi:hypothetical protein
MTISQKLAKVDPKNTEYASDLGFSHAYRGLALREPKTLFQKREAGRGANTKLCGKLNAPWPSRSV